MKMKRSLLLCLTLVVCASLAIGGTLAYLTDTDEEVNVFTMGNVEIDLVEEYENESALAPGVTVEKKAWIENKGVNNAWVWYTYAVPADLDNADALELTFENEDKWLFDVKPVIYNHVIDGVLYNVHNVLYNGLLNVGENTDISLAAVKLSDNVDYQNGQYCIVNNGEVVNIGTLKDENGQIKMILNAYAIQENGIDSVVNAYDLYNGQWGGAVSALTASTAEELQELLNNATEDTSIVLTGKITGDVTVFQRKDVKVVIDGNNNEFAGTITVNGGSTVDRNGKAAVTIKNTHFKADTISADAFINLGKEGDDNTRYTNNVTVENCSFESKDDVAVAVKSYTGGDWNTVIVSCRVEEGMHSLAQLTNVEKGLHIVNCEVYSKNGVNLNNTPSLEMHDCTFDVNGYAVRVGVNGSVNAEAKNFNIVNCNLKSDCAEADDAVVIFRDNATNANVDMTDTTLEGTVKVSGNTAQTIITPASVIE